MPARPRRGQDATIYITTNGFRTRLAALVGAQVKEDTETLTAANPDEYGHAWFVPGIGSWSASATVMVLMGDSESERDAAYRELRSAAREKRYLTVTIEWPDRPLHSGKAILSSLTDDFSLNAPITTGFTLQGVGELEIL